ncbi:MAG: TIGR00282 family metallophosphoesterase [Acidobacteria bacterium]|nr:TIGR00282 family metallophosphoesterase [Acidobacteriota bacterium]
MNILFIGDIFGKPGRAIVADHLADMIQQHKLELVVANGENAAAGFGITPKLAEEILALGVDVITTGNHVWDRREIMEYIPSQPRLIRPANYPSGPGQGIFQGTTKSGVEYAVMNLQGRVFMATHNCPFQTADKLLAALSPTCKIRLVDIHAEATSEKQAMGWHLDGRVTMVAGTHTHIPTADERVLTQGTAYITDVGMTGPYDSVIGVVKEQIVQRFLTQMPMRFEAADGDTRLCAVLIDADPSTGLAHSIQRIMLRAD